MNNASLSSEIGKVLAELIPSLKRLSFSLIRDHYAAEDIVQDTIISVLKTEEEGRVKNLPAYIRRAVWINSIRYRSRLKHWISFELEEIRGEAFHEPSFSEEAELSPYELETGISGLPALQQAIIRLRFYSELSFREIGITLGISMNTVASSCRYALSSLRDEIIRKYHYKDNK